MATPDPRPAVRRAIVACNSTNYELNGKPFKAVIALDAGHPATYPAQLPNFHAVRGTTVIEEGNMTAKRVGLAWLIVSQGETRQERIRLIDRLHVEVNHRELLKTEHASRTRPN